MIIGCMDRNELGCPDFPEKCKMCNAFVDNRENAKYRVCIVTSKGNNYMYDNVIKVEIRSGYAYIIFEKSYISEKLTPDRFILVYPNKEEK